MSKESATARIANALGYISNIPYSIPYVGYYLSMPLRGPAVALKEWSANSEGIKILEGVGVPEPVLDKVRKAYRKRVLRALLTGN